MTIARQRPPAVIRGATSNTLNAKIPLSSASNGSFSVNDDKNFLDGLEALDRCFEAAESQVGGKTEDKVREDFMFKVLAVAKPDRTQP